MWRLKIIIAAGTALLFLAQAANAKIWLPGARKVAEPVASLLADLRKNKSNVFYTDCAIGDAIKAVLIFKAGETEGDFFILAYNPTGMVVAPSKGRVGIKRDGVYVLSVEGTSLQRLPQLAGSMTLGKFVFLGGDQDRASQIVTLQRRAERQALILVARGRRQSSLNLIKSWVRDNFRAFCFGASSARKL